jgi:hypothetical protein
MEYFLIVSFLILGVGITSYKIGIQKGAEIALYVLYHRGVILFDHFGRPVPNLQVLDIPTSSTDDPQ